MEIYSLNKSTLSKKIIENFQSEEVDNQLRIDKFSDGELCPIFSKTIRGKDLFIMADGHTSEDIMKLLLTIDAAKRSGANSTAVIMPYLPYSRSDKNDHIRQSISSKLLADILKSVGISQIITIDLHNPSIQGFYNVPVIHLSPNRIFRNYINFLNLEDICFVAPDQGATKRALNIAKHFTDSSFAVIDKKRLKPNEVSSMVLLGKVEGKNVILLDDIGDTMGTICKASELVMNNGALSVRAALTHGVLSGNALENISKSSLKEIMITDSVASVYDKVNYYYNKYGDNAPKITIISCCDLLSISIDKIIKKEGISDIHL